MYKYIPGRPPVNFPETASFVFGFFVAVVCISSSYWFQKIMWMLGSAYCCWCVSAYLTILTPRDHTEPNIPSIVRSPKEGMKWSDYDYTTFDDDCNLFFYLFMAALSSYTAPIEFLSFELSHDDLFNAQELNHGEIQTLWNKWFEDTYGVPLYTVCQVQFWKKTVVNRFRDNGGIIMNQSLFFGLEGIFCWLQYLMSRNNGFIYKRFTPKTWVYSYHFLEECEHTNHSVPEFRSRMNVFQRLGAFLLFDCVVMVILAFIMPAWFAVVYFPRRTFSLKGLQHLLEYFCFLAFAVPFGVVGQFMEMILCFSWKEEALEDLWHVWYENIYKEDCFINGEDMFKEITPPPPCFHNRRGQPSKKRS